MAFLFPNYTIFASDKQGLSSDERAQGKSLRLDLVYPGYTKGEGYLIKPLKFIDKSCKLKSMSYTTQFRKTLIEYRQKGRTLEEASKEFKVSICTIRDWEKLLRETGSLEKKKRNRPQTQADLLAPKS